MDGQAAVGMWVRFTPDRCTSTPSTKRNAVIAQ
jgi:hypothetical protein